MRERETEGGRDVGRESASEGEREGGGGEREREVSNVDYKAAVQLNVIHTQVNQQTTPTQKTDLKEGPSRSTPVQGQQMSISLVAIIWLNCIL